MIWKRIWASRFAMLVPLGYTTGSLVLPSKEPQMKLVDSLDLAQAVVEEIGAIDVYRATARLC